MCGLSGILALQDLTVDSLKQLIQAMTATLVHRGPDAHGTWVDEGVAFGHRRLSIMDVSSAGAQPMHSACGRYVIAFNGEIYNHFAIRQSLDQCRAEPNWLGHSDTETLLAAISQWGLHKALQRAHGMFAFALWDGQRRELVLVRDRMGEKPLYYAKTKNGWLFASELRALVAGGLSAVVDRTAMTAYLRLGYVPDHLCILEGVRKVMPGGIVVLRTGAEPEIIRYDSVEKCFGSQPTITDKYQAVAALEKLMEQVVGEQMLSDVPLGCFLSGGVDSSLVASLMQAGSDRQISSFSVGFEDPRFNEAPHATAVAAHLGTAHTEFTMREEDALAIVPELSRIYDEPFADSSQVAMTLLCRAARQYVTVALTGDGGDEVFGGYNRHLWASKLYSSLAWIPDILRPAAASAAEGAAWLGRHYERFARQSIAALGLPLTTVENLPKLGAVLRSAGDAGAFYEAFASNGLEVRDFLQPPVPAISFDPRARNPGDMAIAEWFMARDLTGYLPGDILVKVDRAAMSVGLETRTPFLDARVNDLARQIPISLHIDAHVGKKLLRELLYRRVPRALIERPKQGFAIPLDNWLRGALKNWAEILIADEGLAHALGLNAAALMGLWKIHQQRRGNVGKELWVVLMLLLWAKEMAVKPSMRPSLVAAR